MRDLPKMYDDMGSAPSSSSTATEPPRAPAERRRAFYDDAKPASTIDPDAERNAAARRRAEALESQRGAGRRAFYDDMGDPEAAKPAASSPAKPPGAAKPGESGETKPAAPPPPTQQLALDAPEGFDSSSPGWEEFTKTATELRLDAEGAQKLLALHLAEQERARDAAMDAWETAAKADREIGGERLESTVADAREALDRHGTPELRDLLDETGLGSHPEVLRLLARVARTARRVW